MENNGMGIVAGIVAVVFALIVGFFAGRNYERDLWQKTGTHINVPGFQYRSGTPYDRNCRDHRCDPRSHKDQHIRVWPFVDIETERHRR